MQLAREHKRVFTVADAHESLKEEPYREEKRGKTCLKILAASLCSEQLVRFKPLCVHAAELAQRLQSHSRDPAAT